MILEDKVEVTYPLGYKNIILIAEKAANRAGRGKGLKRHAKFENQDLMSQDIASYSHGFRRDQIRKKAQECERLRKADAMNELLDIIVYATVEYLVLEGEIDMEAKRREAGRLMKIKVDKADE